MLKKFVTRFVILLLLTGVGYSGFWFFKSNQFKSQIVKILQDSAFYVSSKDISTYGFPLNQRLSISDLSFTLPIDSLSSHKFIIRNLEISSDLLSKNFAVSKIENVVYNENSSESGDISFIAKPKIDLYFSANNYSIKYSDNGFKIISTATKDLLYSSGPMNLSVDVSSGGAGKISIKLDSSIKDVSSINLFTLYRDGLEPEIIGALENGEIKLSPKMMDSGLDNNISQESPANNNLDLNINNIKAGELVQENKNTKKELPEDVNKNANIVSANEQDLQSLPTDKQNAKILSDAKEVNATNSNTNMDINKEATANKMARAEIAQESDSMGYSNESSNFVEGDIKEVVKSDDIVTKINSVASDVEISLVYDLTPNDSLAKYQIDSDPTKINSIPVSFSKSIEIKSLTISNELYKISLKGKMQNYFDDPALSGSFEIEVNDIANLADYITQEAKNLASNTDSDILEGSDLMIQDELNENNNSYSEFLLKVGSNINHIIYDVINKPKIIQKEEILAKEDLSKNEMLADEQDSSEADIANEDLSNQNQATQDADVADNLQDVNELNDSVEQNLVNSQIPAQEENSESQELLDSKQIVDSGEDFEANEEQNIANQNVVKFTISREKNLEYIINNISFRQIIEEL